MKQTQIAEAINPYAVLGDHALTVINSWRDSIQYGLPPEIYNGNGGPDLENVFGPNTGRKDISLMSAEEFKRKTKAIESFTDKELHCVNGEIILEPLGDVDLTLSIGFYVLRALAQIIDPETKQPILWGYKLKQFDIDEAVMAGIPVNVKNIKANMRVQRVISLSRIFRLMVNFDSSLVFGAKGRYAKHGGKVYINDGNHGTITLVLHGVLTPPVGFSPKETPWQDANQFIACGGDVLPLTVYDLHKCRVQRAKAMKSSGLPEKTEDKPAYYLDTILSDAGFRLVPEAKKDPGPKESNQTANFQAHFKNYCDNEYENRTLFEKALKTVAYAWPGSPLDHAPVWGLIEFYRCQGSKKITDQFIVNVATVLGEKWNSAKQVWPEVQKQRNKQYPKGSKAKGFTYWKDHRFTNTGNNGLMIAAAIYTLLNNREAWIQSQPGRNKGFDLKLNAITSVGGQTFEMDMPYSSKATGSKNHSVFVATETVPAGIRNLLAISEEADEEADDVDLAIGDFENA